MVTFSSGAVPQTTEPVAQLVRDGRERLMAVPGVLDAPASNCLPLQGCFGMRFDVLGRPKEETPSTGVGGYFSISWSYFSAFKIPLLRGRAFSEQDDRAAPGVVIINQAMVRRYWPNGDPLKERIRIGAGGPAFAEPPRQIVGVVGDTRDAGISSDPFPTMYIPIAQMPDAQTQRATRVDPMTALRLE
jgi:putative ABC transport system permease protein